MAESAADGFGAEQWLRYATEFSTLWSGVLAEARAAPPADRPDVYARGAARLVAWHGAFVSPGPIEGLLRLWGPAWVDRLPSGGDWARTMAALQAAALGFAAAQQRVLGAAAASFARRAAALPAAARGLRRHLDLWIAVVDEAHATARRDPDHVRTEMALVNALIALAGLVRRAADHGCAALGVASGGDLARLEARVGELERQRSAERPRSAGSRGESKSIRASRPAGRRRVPT